MLAVNQVMGIYLSVSFRFVIFAKYFVISIQDRQHSTNQISLS